VNSTFLQPFLSYTMKTHTTFLINTESTYDWEGSKWTIPLNPAVSQVLKIGGLPMSFTLGPKLYVEGPSTTPDWAFDSCSCSSSPPDARSDHFPGAADRLCVSLSMI
jgi:hypothetical protein